MDILLKAFAYIDLNAIIAILGAGLFGLFVGSIPGLTATMAVALMVPFTFFMDPIPALALMISVGASSIYAGDIPGALLRIPGTPASAAYVDDSHSLVKQGKVNRVLGLGLSSSVIGGVIGTIILALAAPLLAQFALKFSSFEYMWLSLIGLSCATLISGKFIAKSLLTLLFGIIISTIGFDEFTGQPRFTFGFVSLYEGVSFIPAMIGLFAISGAIDYYVNRNKANSLAIDTNEIKQPKSLNVFKGLAKPLNSRKGSILRSSTMGTLIGALPGAGADIAAWISYAVSKKFSKKPEEYGKGSEDAIIDASSSNNASLAGSWIPSLVFGIPGDSAAAIIIGVLYMKDMQPGPSLFLFQPDKLYAVFILFLIANLALIPLALIVVNFLKRIVSINKDILYPIVIIFSLVGAYAINNSMEAIVVMLIMGIVGYFLQKNSYPISPIILGMILGPMLERNLLASLTKSDGDLVAFVERPVSAVLASFFTVIVILQVWGIIKNFKEKN
ncbi:tripartite tricarboxylate transporter permease [Mannheimia sp. AT1]|uniref:Tripartite tricarboxylate transporter permease n=1 Tax=Mannheimia cairinae TaxID=3025936 RepID=A0ABT5MPG8_9PAST|nr:tripartite tricarboxylate transporter permease [Mannheimia cairinae]MDD0824067.1 tripartite tricarboxylate transporter permease [Mannheimia cairinae]MDD0827183.1 tripartite tricarboxylate transporter permease [Mannheimia cairinae]